jgi:hypothetical protein
MEDFPDIDRAKLLEALGDPFHFSADLPSDAEQFPAVQVVYEPMDTAILLIEFASSELWRDHLHPLNFSSCEEIVSTGGGRYLASNCMLHKEMYLGGEFLDTPTKLVTAIKRLEDLRCWNTAEIVILYAWTSGVINPVDHDSWRLIGHETYEFYRIRGTVHLGTLVRGIKARYRDKETGGRVLCRVEGVRRPVRLTMGGEGGSRAIGWRDHIHRACQLKRLYQFLGHNPTTWEEVVATARVSDDTLFGSESKGGSVTITPTQFLDFTCSDYP